MKLLNRQEQREEFAHRAMVAIGLECHLRNLIREILAGDTTKVVEFQQFVQYAPMETKLRVGLAMGIIR